MKKVIHYAIEAKKSLHKVSNLPINKLAVGTAIAIVPGGLVISGVYLATVDLRKKYQKYKQENENPETFSNWFNKEIGNYMTDKTKYLGRMLSIRKKVQPKNDESHHHIP